MSQSKYIKGFTSEFDETVQNIHRHIQQKDFDAGVACAEERIIKLLEELAKVTKAGDTWHINPFEYAIALIKGEQE